MVAQHLGQREVPLGVVVPTLALEGPAEQQVQVAVVRGVLDQRAQDGLGPTELGRAEVGAGQQQPQVGRAVQVLRGGGLVDELRAARWRPR